MCTYELIVFHMLGIIFFFWGGGGILVRVAAPSFELMSRGQKVSRLPTELPRRPAIPSTIRSRQSGTWSTGQKISEEHRQKLERDLKTQQIEKEGKKEANTTKKSIVLLE